MSCRIAVVIPSKDNAGTIAEVVKGSLAHIEDVWVVDDGCVDDTAALARHAGAQVLVHPTNLGKGAALQTAFRHCSAEGFTHLIAIDADGQHEPDDLPSFIAAIHQDPRAIVVGVRDMSTAPGSSKFGRNFSNFWIWVETGTHVGDSQSGYRAYPLESVLALGLFGSRYELEVEVLTRALWARIPVLDIPCRVFYPPPEERVSSFRPLQDNTRISLLNTRLVIEMLLWPPKRFRSPAPTEEWQNQYRGVGWGWSFVVGMINWTGRWPAYGIVTFLAGWFLLFAAAPRRALQDYSRRIDPSSSVLSRLWRAVRCFHNFALSLVDRFLLLTHGPDSFSFERTETKAAYEALEEGEGLLILAAHVGNPDLGAAALGTRVQNKVNVVLFAGSDPYVRLTERYAGERAPNFIALNDGAQHASLRAVRALKRGEIVAMKADRAVDDRTVEVELFGERVSLPTGPFLVAALSGAPTVWLSCFKDGPYRYQVRCTRPRRFAFASRKERSADLEGWVGEFATQIEDWAKEYPNQWYNFHALWGSEGEA